MTYLTCHENCVAHTHILHHDDNVIPVLKLCGVFIGLFVPWAPAPLVCPRHQFDKKLFPFFYRVDFHKVMGVMFKK